MPIVSADDPQHRIKAIADKYGLTGKGVSIAILDTGYSGSNINIIKKYNVVYEGDDIEDKNGHGSLTANIIGSKDFGIAPEAELYIIKVMEKIFLVNMMLLLKALRKRFDMM